MLSGLLLLGRLKLVGRDLASEGDTELLFRNIPLFDDQAAAALFRLYNGIGNDRRYISLLYSPNTSLIACQVHLGSGRNGLCRKMSLLGKNWLCVPHTRPIREQFLAAD